MLEVLVQQRVGAHSHDKLRLSLIDDQTLVFNVVYYRVCITVFESHSHDRMR